MEGGGEGGVGGGEGGEGEEGEEVRDDFCGGVGVSGAPFLGEEPLVTLLSIWQGACKLQVLPES